MYTWVTSEAWFLLSIISLLMFIFKGLDYSKSLFVSKNRFISMLIPISVLQFFISCIEITGYCKEYRDMLVDILLIYGCSFIIYIYYSGIKKGNSRKGMLINFSLIIFCLILFCIIKCF